MKRSHYAILTAQALSYGLIITFIFADAQYNLTGVLRQENASMTLGTAYIASCLIGIVGVINIWLSWYYMSKSSSVRDMLVICAWTHRVKTANGWVTLEQFFSEQLGYAVSHGLSEEKFLELREEMDRDWQKIKVEPAAAQATSSEDPLVEDEIEKESPRPLGMAPSSSKAVSPRKSFPRPADPVSAQVAETR